MLYNCAIQLSNARFCDMIDFEKPVRIVQIRLYQSNLMTESHDTG